MRAKHAAPGAYRGYWLFPLALLGVTLVAISFGIASFPRVPEPPIQGAENLAWGQTFAANACAECHTLRSGSRMAAPEPGAPPALQWIARVHPDYLEAFLLRPNGPHMLVTGRDAAGLRALFAELAGGL